MYLYQHKDWPHFTWDKEKLFPLLTEIRHRQGRLTGRMEGLGFSLQAEAVLQSITLEVMKSNEIEGNMLDMAQVRSSVARKLGMDIAGLVPSDRHVDGVVEMMLDATQKFKKPLTRERLFAWHAALFPTGRSGMQKITVGRWRNNADNDPMQVVSGPLGKEKVHFEAPPAKVLSKEMKAFLDWFNAPAPGLDAVLKAAIAHLWFVTIHPFDDGNGRIARAIADMQLTRADGIAQRFYSMSAQIRLQRKEYYLVLEKTQRGKPDITEWLTWFFNCLDGALKAAEKNLAGVLMRARYWEQLELKPINTRQKLVLNKLMNGFEGKLTTSKWAKMAKCSQDTALRDILDLMAQGVLEKEPGGGRSTGYRLVEI